MEKPGAPSDHAASQGDHEAKLRDRADEDREIIAIESASTLEEQADAVRNRAAGARERARRARARFDAALQRATAAEAHTEAALDRAGQIIKPTRHPGA
jgi:hypothetical protein